LSVSHRSPTSTSTSSTPPPDDRQVLAIADDVTHAVVADSTDEEALRQLGVQDVDRAVVAIGSNLEASILTTSLLIDLGIGTIWAKALNHQQSQILTRLGAHHVVLPEHDRGERVAHLVTGRMLDFIQFEDDYAIAKTTAPSEARLGTADVRFPPLMGAARRTRAEC
jgi:trk system potassium uptake protein TrkA